MLILTSMEVLIVIHCILREHAYEEKINKNVIWV